MEDQQKWQARSLRNPNLGPRALPPDLSTTVAALWPTPQSKEQKESAEKKVARGAHAGLNLRDAAEGSGLTQNGSSVPTAKRGGLNPAFVCWLMGYPPEWDACGATATPSSRKSRPSSSAPISTVEALIC
jgi:hypothetical protein